MCLNLMRMLAEKAGALVTSVEILTKALGRTQGFAFLGVSPGNSMVGGLWTTSENHWPEEGCLKSK